MISFLIPFRDADGTRTAGHEWMLARWKAHYPDAEFIVAADDGVDPFNKCMAVNNAARQASGDMFVILDADVWVDADLMQQALDTIHSGRAAWAIPARTAHRLTQAASERIMRSDPAAPVSIDRSEVEVHSAVVGFIHVVPRSAFEAVGGMDERIRGWGGDDTLFARALKVVAGRCRRLRGTLWCLWHDRSRDESGRRIWYGQDPQLQVAKRVLASAYSAANTRQKMYEVLGIEPVAGRSRHGAA